MARPELCVLLAYAKLSLKTHMLAGSLPDDPVAESYLLGYFPPAAMMAAGHDNLSGHRLRREIITAQIANDLVGLMGAGFVTRLTRDTGRSPEDVVRAWLIASRMADHRALLSQMAQQTDPLNTQVAYRWLLGLARVLERTTRWVLHNVEPRETSSRTVDENLAGLSELRERFAEVVRGEERKLFEARVGEIRELGAQEAFSRRLMTLRFLDQLLEILGISRETGFDAVMTAHAYYQASEAFEIPWIRRRMFAAAGVGAWEQRAAQALSDDLSRAHRKVAIGLLRRAVNGTAGPAGGAQAGHDYLASLRAPETDRFRSVLEELKAEESVGLSAVSVLTREMSMLADRVARSPDQVDRR